MRQFYVAGDDGQKHGPYGEDFIRSEYAAGVYSASTLVWAEGMPQWASLGSVIDLGGIAPVPTPPRHRADRFSNPLKAFIYACKHIFDFEGRARRKEFWMAFAGILIANIVVSVPLTLLLGGFDVSGLDIGDLGVSADTGEEGSPGSEVNNIVSAAVLLLSLAVTTRRLHDIGRSGWWQILRFVLPVIGDIVILIMCLQDSQPGNNVYGYNPKGQ